MSVASQFPGTHQQRSTLTHLLGHLLHNVAGDVADWSVAQALEEVVMPLQLRGADASVVNVRIQSADEYQEAQE